VANVAKRSSSEIPAEPPDRLGCSVCEVMDAVPVDLDVQSLAPNSFDILWPEDRRRPIKPDGAFFSWSLKPMAAIGERLGVASCSVSTCHWLRRNLHNEPGTRSFMRWICKPFQGKPRIAA
jgi:hypothetical protein